MWPLDLREVWVGSERPWECLEDSNVKEEDLDMRGSWTTGGVARHWLMPFQDNTEER